jgi:hypothetical protein
MEGEKKSDFFVLAKTGFHFKATWVVICTPKTEPKMHSSKKALPLVDTDFCYFMVLVILF